MRADIAIAPYMRRGAFAILSTYVLKKAKKKLHVRTYTPVHQL